MNYNVSDLLKYRITEILICWIADLLKIYLLDFLFIWFAENQRICFSITLNYWLSEYQNCILLEFQPFWKSVFLHQGKEMEWRMAMRWRRGRKPMKCLAISKTFSNFEGKKFKTYEDIRIILPPGIRHRSWCCEADWGHREARMASSDASVPRFQRVGQRQALR